jgi:predicted ATPase
LKYNGNESYSHELGLESLLESFEYAENEQATDLIREMHSLSLGNRASVPMPVRKNLEAVRNAQEELTKESFLKTQAPELIEALREITQGSFAVNNGVLSYQYDKDNALPITIASSSVKSLYHLDLYINNLAKKNDILLIDEPELNLHPDNQRKMARVIARLVNAGVKVLLTTHSDYLVRELNNAIMLSNELPDKQSIMEANQLVKTDILTPDQVSAYAVDTKGEFSEMAVGKLGINTQIFDGIINSANQLQSEIYYSLDEADE